MLCEAVSETKASDYRSLEPVCQSGEGGIVQSTTFEQLLKTKARITQHKPKRKIY